MKKLLSLVLICAMGFGMISCVESEESQSVEALRNAKAEQLKALVNLYNAQAEAEKIIAEAEAAYKNAQAAYQQALADKTQNEIEQAKAEFAYEIEKIKAEYEAAMLKAMKEAKGYEKDILEMANDKLESLYKTYAGYVTSLNNANQELLNKKIALAKVEAAIANITETATKEIEENTALIEELEAKLAILTDNGYSQMDKDSLEAEYFKALAAYNDANYNYLLNEKAAADKAKEAAKKAQIDYFEDYNDKVSEMNALHAGNTPIIGVVIGDEQWTEAGIRYWADYEAKYYGYKTVMVDDDNDPTTPEVPRKELCSWDDSNSEGTYEDPITGKNIIEEVIPIQNSVSWENDIYDHLEVFINEAPLLEFKQSSAEDLKNAQNVLDNATTALENAKAAEVAAKDFEKPFADAAAAREAIAAFKDAYENYDDASETVKGKQEKLARVKADTTGNNNEYNNYIYQPYATLINAEAALDVLTNDKNANYAANQWVKALADAEAALKALPADADKTSAEATVASAQADLNREIYNAQVYLESAKASVALYEGDIKAAEKEIADAQENEAALLAANKAALAAVEVMNNTFGEDSDFYAFWTEEEEDENGNTILILNTKNSYNNYYNNDNNTFWFNINTIKLLSDNNADGNPDLDLTANNGLYIADNSQTYVDFTALIANTNPLELEYEAPDFEKFMDGYTKLIAENTDAITAANKAIAELEDWVSDWDAKEAELRAWVEAKNAEIAEVRAAYDKFAEAEEARAAAETAVTELKAKSDALSAMGNMNGDSELTNLISDIEKDIKDAEEAIEDAKLILDGMSDANSDYNWDYDVETIAYREALIEKYKADIAALEAEVEYYTQMVESAKAALDAELSAQNAAE